jgi:hypothetical protein
VTIGNCELCARKRVSCFSEQESQRMICYVCRGDVPDPYCELEEAARLPTPSLLLPVLVGAVLGLVGTWAAICACLEVSVN